MASSSASSSRPRSHRGDEPYDPAVARDVRISKSLSYLLRHGGSKAGVNIGADGFALLDETLRHASLRGITVDDVRRVVNNSEKKRFQLDDSSGVLRIRATQGHSLKVVQDEHLLKPLSINDPDMVVVHGTTSANWEKIAKDGGLRRMTRNHIHFAKGLFGDANVISGMRWSSDVFIYIDAKAAAADDIEFFESENGVILTAGINGFLSKRYFKKVTSKDGTSLYQP